MASSVVGPETHSSDSGAARVGRFTYHAADGRWDWDDEVFRIHGAEPGSLTPTTEHMLRFKHPEDRERVAEALERTLATGQPLSITYRLNGDDGVERNVVFVCEAGVCQDDAVATIEGYYIDLTTEFEEEARKRAREAVEASAEYRAIIEQAKGSLMLAYGLDADQAFAMLSWWSRNKNIKLRELAHRLVEQSRAGGLTDGDLRRSFDALLHDIATMT